jgi:type I restriction enzyme M protein
MRPWLGWPAKLVMQGNTLTDPKLKDGSTLKTFDYASPIPLSDKRWSTGLDPVNDAYERFQPLGTPPAKQDDYTYGFPAWSARATGQCRYAMASN